MWTDQFLQYLKDSTLAESQVEKAIALKHGHLPPKIYKYRGYSEHARESLTSSTIWLASANSYNDPYDCLLRLSAPSMMSAFERALIDPFVTGYHLDIPLAKMDEARRSATPMKVLSENISKVGSGANPKQMAEEFLKIGHGLVESIVGFLQALRTVIKLCSFSAINDSILMWSHYGNNHQGFCIEYDLESFDHEDAFLRNLYPVIYSHELFDLTPWAEKVVTGKVEEMTTLFPLLGVLQKFEGWQYEQEWRYVLFDEKPIPNRVRPMPVPSGVFLGAKAPVSAAQELLRICEEMKIPVWQMQMSSDKYELIAERVNTAE